MTDMTAKGSQGSLYRTPAVLLVDDEIDILPEYQEFLEMEGFTALVEADPEQALRRILAGPEIAVLVTDLRMARLDGASLIKSVRDSLPAGRKMGFIVLTGDATSSSAALELDVPILLKPVDFRALVAAIDHAIAGAQ